MDESKTYKDQAGASIHTMFEGLVSLGARTEQELKALELQATIPLSFTAAQIRNLRKKEGVTQAVFALYLGVSTNTVSQWERGERQATGAAAKLLQLVKKHGLTHLI